MPRYPADPFGGTCANVIDFSNDGPEPECPLFSVEVPSGGRMLVGHVDQAGRHDPGVPVPAIAHSEGCFEADAVCKTCPAAPEIGGLGRDVLLLVVHVDGCPELAQIRRQVSR